MMAYTDVFVGGTSNIYLIVAGLRIARGVGYYNDTCSIELANWSELYGKMFCEGTLWARDLWRRHSEGGYEDNCNASFVYTNENMTEAFELDGSLVASF